MKIAFDYDKTYQGNEAVFNDIATRFQRAGHTVGILTARHQDKESVATTFHPDFIYYLDCGKETYTIRAKRKAETMRQKKIDLLFDDKHNYFPSDVVVLNIV